LSRLATADANTLTKEMFPKGSFVCESYGEHFGQGELVGGVQLSLGGGIMGE
jgi:hypothetical protein